MFVKMFNAYQKKCAMRELEELLDQIVNEAGEDLQGRFLNKEYPDLKEAWMCYCRTSELLFKYNNNLPHTKKPLWRISHFKNWNRHKIKIAYLQRSQTKRYEEYQFIKKLVQEF